MTSPEHPKLDTIRALLALAEDQAGTEEGELAMSRATAMMARYGLENALKADVFTGGPTTDNKTRRRIRMEAPYAIDKGLLLQAIARPLNVYAIRSTEYQGRQKFFVIELLGFESDVQRVEILYTSLLVQTTRALVKEHVPGEGAKKAAWRRRWYMSFSNVVEQRLEQAEEYVAAQAKRAGQTSASGRSTDLVVMDRRAQVQRWAKEAFPRARTTSRGLGGGVGGFQEGEAAGRRADIGMTNLGGRAVRGVLGR